VVSSTTVLGIIIHATILSNPIKISALSIHSKSATVTCEVLSTSIHISALYDNGKSAGLQLTSIVSSF